MNSYLQGAEADVGFLRAEPTPTWDAFLADFDRYAAEVESRANLAGVPFVAVLLPNRVQAAMLSADKWPAGYDPYKLDNELHAIILSHGGIYLSVLQGLHTIPNVEQDYLPVDGHPVATAHAIFAGLIVKELTSGVIPQLRAVGLHAVSANGR